MVLFLRTSVFLVAFFAKTRFKCLFVRLKWLDANHCHRISDSLCTLKTVFIFLWIIMEMAMFEQIMFSYVCLSPNYWLTYQFSWNMVPLRKISNKSLSARTEYYSGGMRLFCFIYNTTGMCRDMLTKKHFSFFLGLTMNVYQTPMWAQEMAFFSPPLYFI